MTAWARFILLLVRLRSFARARWVMAYDREMRRQNNKGME
jgi:hypothetical protein